MEIQKVTKMKTKTNRAVERKKSNSQQRIKRKPSEALKEKCIVHIQKTKLSDSLLGKLGNKESSTIMNGTNSNLPSKESCNAGGNTISFCTITNSGSERSSCNYLNNTNSKELEQCGNDYKGNTHKEICRTEDEVTHENTEYTQDKDAVNYVKVGPSRKKKKKLNGINIEEQDSEKIRRQFSYTRTINDVVKMYSEPAEEHCKLKMEDTTNKKRRFKEHKATTNSSKKIYPVKETFARHNHKKNSTTITQNTTVQTRIPVVSLENVLSNEHLSLKYNLNNKLNSNHVASDFKSTFNCSTSSDMLNSSMNTSGSSTGTSMSAKSNCESPNKSTTSNSSTSSNIVNLSLNNRSSLITSILAEESIPSTAGSDYKALVKGRTFSCSESSDTSRSLNNTVSSTSQNSPEPIVPLSSESKRAFRCEDKKITYGSIINIQITRNVGADTAIISCVPLSTKGMQMDTTCDNASKPDSKLECLASNDNLTSSSEDNDQHDDSLTSFSEDNDQHDESDSSSSEVICRAWQKCYEFSGEDKIKVDSSNSIFEKAEFFYEANKHVNMNDKDLKSVPVKKTVLPLIIRTIDNNYANRSMIGSMRDLSNPSQTSTSGSDSSRVNTSINSDKILEQTRASGSSNNSRSPSPKPVSTVSNTSNVNVQNIDAPHSPHSRLSTDSSNSSISGMDNSPVLKKLEFKMPLLPPAKRPPGFKFKSAVRNTLSSTPKVQPETSSTVENDDAISMTSCSYSSLTNLEEELLADDQLDGIEKRVAPLEGKDALKEHKEDISKFGVPTAKTPPLVEDSELEVNCSPARSSTPTNSNNLQNNINQWFTKNHSVTDQLQVKFPSNQIPVVFKRLCYYHFIKNNCLFQKCKKIHNVRVIGHTIRNLAYEELIEAYVYTKSRHKLYTETFEYFVSALERLKCTNLLMQLVKDILNIEIYNKTPLIQKIVETLCNIGVPFIDVIEEILMSGDKNVCLSDILLDIVCISHKQNLYNNWCIVQQLIKHRTELLDRGLVEEIMTMCCQHNHDKLAVHVVQDFILPKVVDLKTINIHTLNNFLSVLESHEIEKQIVYTEMERNDILIILPLHSPTPNDKQGLHYDTNSNKSNKSVAIDCNKSNPVNAIDENFAICNNNSGFISGNVTRAPKKSSPYSGENNNSLNISPKLQSNNQSEPQFYNNFECNDVLKNSSALGDSSNQISNNKYPDNMESHDGEIELGSDKYEGDYPPSPVFSDVISEDSISSNEEVNSHFGAEETFELDINSVPFNSQNCSSKDVSYRFSTSVECSVGTERNKELEQNKIGNLESRLNNEFHHNLNEDDNLSSSTSTYHIPVDALECHEILEDTDLLLLKSITERGNNLEFFMMLSKFKDTTLSRAFMLNTLVYYKAKQPEVIYDMFFPIITGVAHLSPSFSNDDSLMDMLNMLAVNILGLLEHCHAYDKASNILLQFQGKYDKLCTSTWLMGPHRYNYSEIGKYIYFCKIYVRGYHLKDAWDILTDPDLRLLYGMNKWLLKHCDCFDNKLRNFVLEDLINIALDMDLQFAKDVILYIINDNNVIKEIEIWKHFNQLLLKLVDNEESTKELESMIENIIEGWYKYLYPAVMRGLLVRLALELPEHNALELYDKCCRRRCYMYIRGDEKKLFFTTNMLEEEIYMTFYVYMYKKVRNNFPLDSIILMIRLPDPAQRQPHILSNPCGNVQDTKLKIADVLARGFPFTICINYSNEKEQYIIVQQSQLQPLFNYYWKLKQRSTT